MWIALFLAPALAFFALVYAIPMGTVIVTSFADWNGFGRFRWIGVGNFAELFADRQFRLAIRNSLLWGAIAAGVHVPLGVVLALTLHRRPIGWRFVRSVSLLPNLIPPAALALLYTFVFNPGIGVLNQLVRAMGFRTFTVNWFYEPTTAFLAVTSVWVFYAGVIVLITMGELAGVPAELREAAVIDGASERQVDWHIHLHLLRNVIAVGIIIAVTEVFKMFDYVFLTTGGGPDSQTMSLGLLIYNQAAVRFRFGYANAAGVVLLLMGLAAFFVVSRLLRLHAPED
jgi:raffinose/stachyose/melibiose transport system permease protein